MIYKKKKSEIKFLSILHNFVKKIIFSIGLVFSAFLVFLVIYYFSSGLNKMYSPSNLVMQINDKILGPVNAPIFRIKRKYRVRLLIRGRKSLILQSSLSKIISKYKFPHGIKLTVDVDPINFN